MNDIFISYANADRDVAQAFADAFEAFGWSVWWDREIPHGKAFDQVIEAELTGAGCVVVLWSAEAVRSRWVKTEAGAAAERERLMPILIEDVAIPLEFRRIQTAMLQGWRGEREHPEFIRLIESIREMLGSSRSGATAARQPGPRASPPRANWLKRAGIGAAALLALAIIVSLMVLRKPTDAPVRPATTSEPPVVTQPEARRAEVPIAAGAADKAPAASVKGAYRLRIGERIEEGVPGPGAGHIETPGETDVYTFNASAGQSVYFRVRDYGRRMEQIRLTLSSADGQAVFESRLGYGDPGVHRLRKGGTYSMTVGSEREAATGPYRLQLFDVPAPQKFLVKIGDVIQEGQPGPGAGEIESPGAKDVYTINVAAGQRIYFRKFDSGRGLEQIVWTLTDSDGNSVFDSRLGYGEPGVQVLRKGGAYTMTLGSDRVAATGVYRLQLFNVPPPQQFAVKIGDTIRKDSPGAGAGEIETPGAKDIYTFNAAAGQSVHFRKIEHSSGMEQISWTLSDSDGTIVFDSRLGYGDPGVRVLRKGGSYVMSVGSDRVPATGTYRLQLTHVSGT